MQELMASTEVSVRDCRSGRKWLFVIENWILEGHGMERVSEVDQLLVK